ncbi:MAG: TetR/AcrR family transcriptional regulator C-terminal domain-containing protein, partial [Myxococcales bacterium]|nr:TetR/AcrR family transcriptional regulator C-terminal domain-containing protein [Myxococcales bacterium]
IMMMSWSNPEDELSLEKISAKSEAYRRAGAMIRTFFEREIEAGRIAAADPTVLARVFMGSLHHFAMSQLLVLADKGPLAIPPEAFVQGLVDLIVRAAVPAPAHHRTKLERL